MADYLTAAPVTRASGLGATQGHSVDAFGSYSYGTSTDSLALSMANSRYISFSLTPAKMAVASLDSFTMYAFVPEKESGGVVFSNPRFTLFSSLTG